VNKRIHIVAIKSEFGLIQISSQIVLGLPGKFKIGKQIVLKN
jgi:hypothetical protein